MESFNSDVIMVVNGQRITAFVNDCLCGIKAITQYVFEPRSDRRDLLATKFNSEIFTEKERPSYFEQL